MGWFMALGESGESHMTSTKLDDTSGPTVREAGGSGSCLSSPSFIAKTTLCNLKIGRIRETSGSMR